MGKKRAVRPQDGRAREAPSVSWLDRLEAIWKKGHADELKKYHKTGMHLRVHLYDMPGVMRRGSMQLVRDASERLGVPTAEVRRMAKFAWRFRDVAAVRKKYPQARTWAELRKLCPSFDTFPTVRRAEQAAGAAFAAMLAGGA